MAEALAGAVLLAAGQGTRLKAGTRKANLRLGGKPIFEWPLLSLLKSPLIGEIALVVHAKDFKDRMAWVSRRRFKKPVRVIVGGAERQDSVGLGIQALQKKCKVLLIHDAARPFLRASLIRDCVLAAKRHGGSLALVKVKDSIKLMQGKRLKAVPREKLLAAQTPQAASAELLQGAHAWARRKRLYFTDEASLLEARGQHSAAVMAYYENFKITTPEDLINARALIKHFRF
jgi:2-C-methyl-D-erythritol 4-phosphate cytidylyltransferase